MRGTHQDLLTTDNPWAKGYDWPVVIWIAVVHIGAWPRRSTWKALGLAAFLAWLTGSFGVCMGYHRLLTHKSFQTYRPIRWLLALMGGLSGEGSALIWVASIASIMHSAITKAIRTRPHDGPWWSHMLWFMPNFGRKTTQTELFERYAPDMLKDTMIVVLHYLFLPSHIIAGWRLWPSGISAGTRTPAGRSWSGACSCGWCMCCT